jgi:aryl-alcohol dehydrogenase-like predicted oxidoreductase
MDGTLAASAAAALATVALVRRRAASTPALELGELGFGCWQLACTGSAGSNYWGVEYTDELAAELIEKAIDAGVRYFDTAEDYQKGESEKQLGRVLQLLSPERRAKVVIGSKIPPNSCNEIESHLDGTLERLQVDSIGLYMVHWPIDVNSMGHFAGGHASFGASAAVDEKDVPSTAAAFAELAALQRRGKIRSVGVSNFGVAQLTEALATGCAIAVNEVSFSLLFRAAEFDVIPFCAAHGIKVVAYSPLLQGLLAGAATSGNDVAVSRARSRHFAGTRTNSRHGEAGHEALVFATLAALRAIADELGVPLVHLALAYPLRKGCSTVLAGFTKTSYVAENAAGVALAATLDDATLARLDAATEELKQAMGPNLDLWQGVVDGVMTGRVR